MKIPNNTRIPFVRPLKKTMYAQTLTGSLTKMHHRNLFLSLGFVVTQFYRET